MDGNTDDHTRDQAPMVMVFEAGSHPPLLAFDGEMADFQVSCIRAGIEAHCRFSVVVDTGCFDDGATAYRCGTWCSGTRSPADCRFGFWEDRELMERLSDERVDVYLRYLDRVLRRVKAGHTDALAMKIQ